MKINKEGRKGPAPKVSKGDLEPGVVYCRHELHPAGAGLWMFTSNGDMVSIETGDIKRVNDFVFPNWREVNGTFHIEE